MIEIDKGIIESIQTQLNRECNASYSVGYRDGKLVNNPRTEELKKLLADEFAKGWDSGRLSVLYKHCLTKQDVIDAYSFLEGVVGEGYFKRITDLAYIISQGRTK